MVNKDVSAHVYVLNLVTCVVRRGPLVEALRGGYARPAGAAVVTAR